MEDEDNASNLQNEVAWCIDQLFQSINSGKLSERKGMDSPCKDISHSTILGTSSWLAIIKRMF